MIMPAIPSEGTNLRISGAARAVKTENNRRCFTSLNATVAFKDWV